MVGLKSRSAWLLGGIALALGFMSTQQMLVVNRLSVTARVREGQIMSYLITRAVQQNAQLTLTKTSEQARLAALGAAPPLSRLTAAVRAADVAAGLTPVSGSGVEVVIHDGTQPAFPGEPAMLQLVHDQYVLHIVGLLMGAGATAVAVNGQRYVSTTAIFCSGPTIRINGVSYASPYVIQAVGSPSQLLNALNSDPDIAGWSQFVSIHYHAVSVVDVPAYTFPVHFSAAKPAKIGQANL